jgi:hypothetical protein
MKMRFLYPEIGEDPDLYEKRLPTLRLFAYFATTEQKGNAKEIFEPPIRAV